MKRNCIPRAQLENVAGGALRAGYPDEQLSPEGIKNPDHFQSDPQRYVGWLRTDERMQMIEQRYESNRAIIDDLNGFYEDQARAADANASLDRTRMKASGQQEINEMQMYLRGQDVPLREREFAPQDPARAKPDGVRDDVDQLERRNIDSPDYLFTAQNEQRYGGDGYPYAATTGEDPRYPYAATTGEDPSYPYAATTGEDPSYQYTATTGEDPRYQYTATTGEDPSYQYTATTGEDPSYQYTATTGEDPSYQYAGTTGMDQSSQYAAGNDGGFVDTGSTYTADAFLSDDGASYA